MWTLSFSPDGKTIATGSHNGHINLFNVDTGEKQSSLDTRGKFTMSIAHVSYYITTGAYEALKEHETNLIIGSKTL